VRSAAARTRVALRGKTGLGAEHAFGTRVDDLTGAPLRTEPRLVLGAAARTDDLPAFAERDAIKADLIARATAQETNLVERDAGYLQRDRLRAVTIRTIADAADALIRTKAALDGRFPRQRAYVARFFLSFSGGSAPEVEEEPTTPAPATPTP
jgi:hypothetical protein